MLGALAIGNHHHRDWEYGIALNALRAFGAKRILDVGGSHSHFAAAAAWVGMDVTVIDPQACGHVIDQHNSRLALGTNHGMPIRFLETELTNLPEKETNFDAIACLSVIEHVPDSSRFVQQLAARLRSGGLLFLTTDFHPDGQSHHPAQLRTYTSDMLHAVQQGSGLSWYGAPGDYRWAGPQVYDYSFASMCLQKPHTREVLPPVAPTAPVLLLNHSQQRCGVYQLGKRVACLTHTTYQEIESPEQFTAAVGTNAWRAVVINYHPGTMPWLTPELVRRVSPAPAIAILHDYVPNQGFDAFLCLGDRYDHNPRIYGLPRPLPTYATKPTTNHDVPIIGSFGLGFHGKGFSRLVRLVADQLPAAKVRLHIVPADFHHGPGYAERTIHELRAECLAAVRPGVEIEFSHDLLPEPALLDFLSGNDMNCFLYDDRGSIGISSTVDYALAVRRPLAVTRSSLFRHLPDTCCVEYHTLPELLTGGISHLEPLLLADFAAEFETAINLICRGGR